MKKKLFFIVALAAGMMLASCASSDDGLQTNVEQPTDVTPDDGKFPIGFTAYADRAITRGGQTGLTDITALRKSTGAFGVFAYYTDLKKYDQTYVPNIMYNQKVYDANVGAGDANWTYSPIVYWPNESGSDAQSDDEDKVSFFAYAPYVQHTSAASGSVDDASYGITGFSRNTNAGDPLVKYIANFNTANTVDLCWGVCNEPAWAKIQGGTSQSMAVGKPWIDVEHPQTTNQKMNFTFKHALAQLNVQIDADADEIAHADGTGNDVIDNDNTKIYVRSISFTGIAMRGALNLNNTVANQALWLDYSGTTDLPYGESVTVKDGRRDGREGAAGAEATNETPAGLNPEIIQNSTATTGVTTTYQNLFAPSGTITDPENPDPDELAARLKEPVYVIPTGEAMTVTIVYDVETVSPLLPGYLSDGTTHGSSIENKITKTIYYNGSGLSLESGKKYTLQLHLGMNSVKFDASVDSWDNTVVNANGWLPENVSAVRIMNNSNQITHATMSTSDAPLALTGAVTPSAADQTLTWTSSNGAVATVANGTVTAVADGECVITATSNATGKSASIKLLVTHKYSDVTTDDIRKVIAANGYIYENTTKAAEYGTNGVGIICYVGAAGSVDASSTSYKALAWALTDANDGATCQWKNEKTDCSGLTNVSGYANARQDKTGIDNTRKLTNADGSGDCAGHTHVAATAASSYAVTIGGFTHSDWFLPAEGQWNMMMMSLMKGTTYEDGDNRADPTGDVTDYTAEVPDFASNSDKYWHYGAVPVNKVIEPLGATPVMVAYYWSSTENGVTTAWPMSFSRGTLDSSRLKSSQGFVRPVFAF